MIAVSGAIASPEGRPLGELRPLAELSLVPIFSREEMLRIIGQARFLLDNLFAHLPLKAALHAVSPVQELRLLESRIDDITELEFHHRLINLFVRIRDRHTKYESRLGLTVATLPFRLERCFDGPRMLYIVANEVQQLGDPNFVKGVEVTHWNGVPIARAVEINGERLPGGNPEAQRALGERYLTQRPLSRFLPPDESFVRLTYVSGGTPREIEFAWSGLSFLDAVVPRTLTPAVPENLPGQGIDETLWLVNQSRKALFAPRHFDRESLSAELQTEMTTMDVPPPELATTSTLPNFVFRSEITPHGTFGYVRIWDFGTDDADVFLAEFVRIIKLLPQNGLIIDIRDNPGGYIKAGELLLQTLTPHHITPSRFHFRNTGLTRAMCERNTIVSRWFPSIRQAVLTGATYSQGFPIEGDNIDYNRVGQQYHGPVVLITSALSYSTSDMVTADFYDNEVGKILGVDANIGAGGANNWGHDLIRLFNPGFQLPADLQVDLVKGVITDQLREAMRANGVILSDQAVIMAIPASDFQEWRVIDLGKIYIFRLIEWMNDKLNVYFDGDTSPVQDLPRGVTLGFSVRMSTRTNLFDGLPLEDLGVTPDAIHKMTRRDVLEGNLDLIAHAGEILPSMPRYKLEATIESSDVDTVRISIETENLDRLDVNVNDRPVQSIDLKDTQVKISISKSDAESFEIELKGYKKTKLVAARRIAVAS
jgi:hypothetical protein